MSVAADMSALSNVEPDRMVLSSTAMVLVTLSLSWVVILDGNAKRVRASHNKKTEFPAIS